MAKFIYIIDDKMGKVTVGATANPVQVQKELVSSLHDFYVSHRVNDWKSVQGGVQKNVWDGSVADAIRSYDIFHHVKGKLDVVDNNLIVVIGEYREKRDYQADRTRVLRALRAAPETSHGALVGRLKTMPESVVQNHLYELANDGTISITPIEHAGHKTFRYKVLTPIVVGNVGLSERLMKIVKRRGVVTLGVIRNSLGYVPDSEIMDEMADLEARGLVTSERYVWGKKPTIRYTLK